MQIQEQEFVDVLACSEQEKQKNNGPVELKFKPQPVADSKLTVQILDILKKLVQSKQVRKGVNEITKAFDKNQVEFVIIAADCDPIEIVMTLPAICQEKSIPYCFICSKHALGRSCGIIRPVVAAAVIHKEGSLLGPILEMKDRIEQLFI